MKTEYLCVLIRLSLVFLTSCQCGRELTDTDRSQIEQEVLAAHRQIIHAAQETDPETMFSHILDSEGVIMQNGLFHKSRQAALDYAKERFVGAKKLEYQFDHEIVEVLSADKALLKASGTSKLLTNDGREFNTPFCETVVFTKTLNGWKILQAHQSTPVR